MSNPDEVQPDPPLTAASTPKAPARRGWTLAAVVALGVFAVLAAGMLVAQTSKLDDRDAEVDEREEVEATAAAVAEAILSYDYNDIEGSLDRVEEHIGGEFADVYAETFRSVQVPVITQLQAVATAEVQLVYVTAVDEGTAHAIVLVDQTVQSTAGLRTLTGTYLQLDLVERDGRWVVESIPLRISSQNETLTPIPGAETTTTTAVPAG